MSNDVEPDEQPPRPDPAGPGQALRPEVRIRFVDFWDSFDPQNNWFTRLLERRYRLVHVERPDFLIYSCMGGRRKEHLRHDCVRIFYSGENIPPDWNTCDWAFTFEHTPHPRHFRLPLWALYADPLTLVKTPADFAAEPPQKPGFCAFVVSNPLCKTRNRFFERLSKYRRVDSGGKLFNNVGGRVADKRAFIAGHTFTIAFENASHPGYTTEKLIEPMLAGSIPIYWGDPLVGVDFDTRSFLSAHDSPSLDDLVERVVALDRDPALRAAAFSHPWFRDNQVPLAADAGAVLEQFTRIFETPILPVARRRSLARLTRLDRLPAAAGSLKRRLLRKYRQLTSP